MSPHQWIQTMYMIPANLRFSEDCGCEHSWRVCVLVEARNCRFLLALEKRDGPFAILLEERNRQFLLALENHDGPLAIFLEDRSRQFLLALVKRDDPLAVLFPNDCQS